MRGPALPPHGLAQQAIGDRRGREAIDRCAPGTFSCAEAQVAARPLGLGCRFSWEATVFPALVALALLILSVAHALYCHARGRVGTGGFGRGPGHRLRLRQWQLYAAMLYTVGLALLFAAATVAAHRLDASAPTATLLLPSCLTLCAQGVLSIAVVLVVLDAANATLRVWRFQWYESVSAGYNDVPARTPMEVK